MADNKGSYRIEPGFTDVPAGSMERMLNVQALKRKFNKLHAQKRKYYQDDRTKEMHKRLMAFCDICLTAGQDKMKVSVIAQLLSTDRHAPLVYQYVCKCGDYDESFILAVEYFEDVTPATETKNIVLPPLSLNTQIMA